MRKPSLFVVGWALLLTVALVGIYFYIVRSTHSGAVAAREFFSSHANSRHINKTEGWFDGVQIKADNYKLYPANEIAISIPLEGQGIQGRYEIEVSSLNSDNLLKVQKIIQSHNARFFIRQNAGLYAVTIPFEDKETMVQVYEDIKKLSLSVNFIKKDER